MTNMDDTIVNLNLLYDKTTELTDGVYGVMSNNLYGFIDNREKSKELVVDTEFAYAIYTENYIGLWNNRYATDSYGILYLINSRELIKYNSSSANNGITEHCAMDYRIVTLTDNLDDENKQVKIIDTQKGKVIAIASDKVSYRPADPNIVIGYEDIESKKLCGITMKLEIVDIEEYLRTIYKTVKVERGRIMCQDNDGTTIKLNKYGQCY